jgi:sigma-B regulation protein RsbU (phosphoserine phosphatase)
VADAEGHSASAAVLMAMTCALFRSFENVPLGPDQVLEHINRHLCKVADPSFVTALFAVYSTADRKLRVSNAGHPAPMIYVCSESRAVEFTFKGLYPMGVYPYEQVPIGEIKLMPGDRLLFYTDGITERFDHDGKPYGKERLLRRLETEGATNPHEILKAIIEDVDRFAGGRPADDDQLLLVAVIG